MEEHDSFHHHLRPLSFFFLLLLLFGCCVSDLSCFYLVSVSSPSLGAKDDCDDEALRSLAGDCVHIPLDMDIDEHQVVRRIKAKRREDLRLGEMPPYDPSV